MIASPLANTHSHSASSSIPAASPLGPLLSTMRQRSVDLKRFMGDWYVLGCTPSPIEHGAHNAIENYALNPDGSIATTFSFNKGGFDGPRKVYKAVGTVHNKETNAEWRMMFLWPFKLPYIIQFLDDSYSLVVVGTPSKKYYWVMARQPIHSPEMKEEMRSWLTRNGYKLDKLVVIPHSKP